MPPASLEPPPVSRSERLLALLQALRRHRRPITGRVLAAELGISIRTLYRDIGSLQAQGAHIDGAPGLGYVLRPGFMRSDRDTGGLSTRPGPSCPIYGGRLDERYPRPYLAEQLFN